MGFRWVLHYQVVSSPIKDLKSDRKTKWIVEPSSQLESRGQKSLPLATFNPVVVGDPKDNLLLHVLYVADNLRGISKAEVLAGFLLMEYVRKRVFVIRTRSASSMGSGALFCWAQFRDLVTPRKNRQLQGSTFSSRKKSRKLHRRRQIVRPKDLKPPLQLAAEDIMIKKIMSEEDINDPFASSARKQTS